jgi:ABC-type branched-subunit amino acid transport system ATPase component
MTLTHIRPSSARHPSSPVVLKAEGLSAGYGVNPVIANIDIDVSPGQVVALLGPNGAGKTTTVMSLAGILKPLAGTVSACGATGWAPLHRRARTGLGYVSEERSVFMALTVAENLRVARADKKLAFSLFPELSTLAGRRAGLLSGGEQQMLALAKTLGRRPGALIADELSLGLAPKVVDRLLAAVRQAANDEGLGAIIVEQQVKKALKVADYVYVLRRGQIRMHGTAEQIRLQVHELQELYLSTQRREIE